MNVAIKTELFLSVPWVTDGLREFWTQRPVTNSWSGEDPGWMRAPVRIRALPAGEIAVLASDPAYAPEDAVVIHRYSSQGTLLGMVQISPPAMEHTVWRITDFLADQNGNVYLLEMFGSGNESHNSLRKLNESGESVWTRTGPPAAEDLALEELQGTFSQLLMDIKGTPYLPATQHRGLVARIESTSGELEFYADLGEWTGEVFMDGDGNLYYVYYDPESRRRGWASFDPRTGNEEVHFGDDSVYGLFDIPFGTDAQGRCYTAMGMRLACLSRHATLLWQQQIDNILMGPDGDSFYISTTRQTDDATTVQVRHLKRDGAFVDEKTLLIPARLAHEKTKVWRLVEVKGDERFHVSGRTTATSETVLLIYSPEGVLEEITQPAPDAHATECQLQGGSSWSVDLHGSVYLPVLGPKGFHLFRITSETGNSAN